MYEFLTGPAVWAAFAIFFVGIIYRVIWYFRGLDWKMDRVAYRAWPAQGARGAIRSVVYWLIPFKTRSWRVKPGMTFLFFGFHLGLLLTPVFLEAHGILIRKAWGINWPALPSGLADGLTILVMVTAVFLILRRVILPEVRIMSTGYDYLLMAITAAPFVTGFLARLAAPGYDFWLYAHIISGLVLLIAIPFTKLAHVVLFFCSRIQLGMDYGIKRGGMKGTDLSW